MPQLRFSHRPSHSALRKQLPGYAACQTEADGSGLGYSNRMVHEQFRRHHPDFMALVRVAAHFPGILLHSLVFVSHLLVFNGPAWWSADHDHFSDRPCGSRGRPHVLYACRFSQSHYSADRSARISDQAWTHAMVLQPEY